MSEQAAPSRHPRTLGWIGTTALAMGGSNQMIFLITALFVGQGDIRGQGSAAVLLLIIGLLLSWAAAPAWTELVLMWPNRVGGIAAGCTDAFRPYNPVLTALTGTCYWWGWVPTCGLTALLSAAAIQQWLLPGIRVEAVAIGIIAVFTLVNLAGVKWVARLAIPVAAASALLAFLSAFVPILSGSVDWRQAFDFHLSTPFPGLFGQITSVMAGLYLIGFAAPAFEAATCHVGETIDPNRNVPKAVLASAAMAGLYFVVLPVVWLGVLGPEELGHDLATVLGPTFAPLFGSLGRAAAIWFIIFNMFHGTLQPLAGAARTLAQLSEDGVLPRFLGHRSSTDAPTAATLATALFAIIFLLMGDPVWMIAAANFTYLISVCMPVVAVWLLRRDRPDAVRPYRAGRGLIGLGLGASLVWLVTAILGFQQFGLPTVLFGLALAYSGAALYAWRVMEDRRREGLPILARTLHVKLTGAMLVVLLLDGAAYLMAISNVPEKETALVAALEDIFVAVALLSISVGLILPGMITHSATEVSKAARRLATGTLRQFSDAMAALGRGDLDAARASVDIRPVPTHSRDELGEMGESFNIMQDEVKRAVHSLDEARERLRTVGAEMAETTASIVHLAHHDPLTGLPNRVAFAKRLSDTFQTASTTGSAFAVLCLDLDDFKEANDVFGHAGGDQLLKAVSERLTGVLDGAFLARVGGDEFTVISSSGPQPETARALAARLLAAVSEPFSVRGERIAVGLSIGAALFPVDGTDSEALLGNADAALYRAKADGRRVARFYQPSVDRSVREGHALQVDLRSAVALDQLVLHYQPQATIDGRVFGFEALVRWNHPRRGLIPPGEFIPLAERMGVIREIGEWVLRAAAQEAARWSNRLQISVNLSPGQFVDADLPAIVRGVLAETGLDPSRLELEITESLLIRDQARSLAVLQRLRSLGVRIAMDDFGTGYSSLASLQSFRFDKLKIDRSFVTGLRSEEQSRVIVRAVISLGAALQIPVIAEGVETEEERAVLKREGCTEIQGYLIGRPQPIAFYAAITSAGGSADGSTAPP